MCAMRQRSATQGSHAAGTAAVVRAHDDTRRSGGRDGDVQACPSHTTHEQQQQQQQQHDRHNNSKSLWLPLELAFVTLMDHMPYVLVRHVFPRITNTDAATLAQLRTRYVHPYRGDDAAHADLLRRLWRGHHRVQLTTRDFVAVDAQWQTLGFQGKDPATDFRGAGALALRQLVYLVERHPEDWHRMCGLDFLCAAAGINVSMRLITLLHLNTQTNLLDVQHTPRYSTACARVTLCRYFAAATAAPAATHVTTNDADDDDDDAVLTCLNEVYCVYMRVLHRRWRQSSRNLMEFNTLLTALYTEMDRLLYVCDTFDELAAQCTCA